MAYSGDSGHRSLQGSGVGTGLEDRQQGSVWLQLGKRKAHVQEMLAGSYLIRVKEVFGWWTLRHWGEASI